MRISVDRFSAEYGDCGSHEIVLDLEVSSRQMTDLVSRAETARIAELESELSHWMETAGRRAKELNELKTRVKNLERLYSQRHAGVLNADAVMAVMGLPVEGGHDLCTRNSQTCLAIDCGRRLYREGSASCNPSPIGEPS